MTGKVLQLSNVLLPDQMATQIANQFLSWDMLKAPWKASVLEVKQYVFATDTRHTSNGRNPWKNSTVIPKLCQVRDNVYSNYTATLFPKRKNIYWDANEASSNSRDKRDCIQNYMTWAMDQASFKHEMDKALMDYIDTGNCFGTVKWVDERVDQPDKMQSGYVGPAMERINPQHLVMNPTAESFPVTPKIVRSIISKGELKELLQKLSNDENRQEYEDLWKYLKDIRGNATSYEGTWTEDEALYQMEGFGSFRQYLQSDHAEILTFYGDLYDPQNDTFLKNHVIMVVDRHKLIGKKPNPSFFGNPPIYHVPWRKRQDNLWGMGPLDNLVSMQYRMDHVENMKADIFDLTTYPVTKIKGFVEDFTWQPGERIWLGDEGDVEMVVPNVEALKANFEIQNLERLMEEMAGAPREAMGFRTPGEKTKYEVQSLENASARVFQNKIKQFEEQFVEPILNAMLELARRNLTGTTTIKVFDDEFKMATFQTLSVDDITGIGRIKPVAARHFAEQAQLVQNLTSLAGSQLWPTVQPHFSSVKLAKILECVFDLEEYEVVTPYIALAEQADAQKQAHALQEQVMMESQTATGLGSDFDLSAIQQGQPQAPAGAGAGY